MRDFNKAREKTLTTVKLERVNKARARDSYKARDFNKATALDFYKHRDSNKAIDLTTELQR